mmetsp:Transcript_3666/g.11406  ORF Transcript_3666/g.11406 Transcript_3666/m.11406 type:complete len:215 (+) Transcript_3666:109-753(+)
MRHTGGRLAVREQHRVGGQRGQQIRAVGGEQRAGVLVANRRRAAARRQQQQCTEGERGRHRGGEHHAAGTSTPTLALACHQLAEAVQLGAGGAGGARHDRGLAMRRGGQHAIEPPLEGGSAQTGEQTDAQQQGERRMFGGERALCAGAGDPGAAQLGGHGQQQRTEQHQEQRATARRKQTADGAQQCAQRRHTAQTPQQQVGTLQPGGRSQGGG